MFLEDHKIKINGPFFRIMMCRFLKVITDGFRIFF